MTVGEGAALRVWVGRWGPHLQYRPVRQEMALCISVWELGSSLGAGPLHHCR